MMMIIMQFESGHGRKVLRSFREKFKKIWSYQEESLLKMCSNLKDLYSSFLTHARQTPSQGQGYHFHNLALFSTQRLEIRVNKHKINLNAEKNSLRFALNDVFNQLQFATTMNVKLSSSALPSFAPLFWMTCPSWSLLLLLGHCYLVLYDLEGKGGADRDVG